MALDAKSRYLHQNNGKHEEARVHILLLGGSNAGVHFGWAKTLAKLVPQHEVENSFLGAVGSLFGLLRLLKLQRENRPRPDVVLFEYALNDGILYDGKSLTAELLEDTLEDVVAFCAAESLPLLFLCLASRPLGDGRLSPTSHYIDGFYHRAARRRRMATPLTLTDILGDVDVSHYVDPFHLGEASSRLVAEAVAQRLRSPIPVPSGPRRTLSFDYVEASHAHCDEGVTLSEIGSPVFQGVFVELARGQASRWPCAGRLASIMALSNESSGFFRIRAEGEALRKNAQSKMCENVPQLIMMYYVVSRLRADGEIVIDMPANESDLTQLPHDPTLMERPPNAPFATQTLLVNAIMVQREAPLTQRLLKCVQAVMSLNVLRLSAERWRRRSRMPTIAKCSLADTNRLCATAKATSGLRLT
jgi:hypothetical protein